MRLSSSKPISSPSRGEKFPPPLMRFLKSNGGSRSRGSSRSRSSPMFVRSHKKNANGGGVETTQEPSSPKVTCMGQVRVRRSKKTSSSIVDHTGSGRRASKTTHKRGSCRWIRKALFCRCFSGKSKPRSCRPVWRGWCGFFGVGFGRKVETSEESGKGGSRKEVMEEYEDDEQFPKEEEEDEDEEEDKDDRAFAPASTPPKNALLLMRCRSDPCRNRFWNSPSPSFTEDKPEVKNRTVVQTEGEDEEEEDDEEEETPRTGNESICTDSAAESRADPKIEEKLGFCQGFENSSKGRIRSAKTSTTTSKIKVESSSKGSGGGSSSSSSACSSSSSSSRPSTLIRCKSEPATRRRSLKLETAETACLWKNRRSGFDEKCPPQFLL